MTPARSAPAVALAAVLATGVPDPGTILVILGAAGLGLGIGAGVGYTAYRQRKTKADIQAYKAWDDAKRASTLARLDRATERLMQREAQINDLAAQVERFKTDLDAEQDQAEKLRADLVGFALQVLRDRKYLTEEKAKADAEAAGGAGESHATPDPDRRG